MASRVDLDSSRKLWPHVPGPVVVAYTPDGTTLYSGGYDGYVRAHNPDPESTEDAKIIEDHEQTITSLDCTYDDVVTASEDGTVKFFDHETLQFRSLITRSNIGMAIRDAKVNRQRTQIAVASDELTVKVINLRETEKLRLLSGHSKPVSAVSWSPDGSLLATSSLDGSIRIWAVDSEDITCKKVLSGLIGTHQPESNLRMDVVWHPSGTLFAIATSSNDIALISTETFEKTHTLDPEAQNSDISTLAWSANGNYLVSSLVKENKILIWDFVTKLPIITTIAPALVTSITFCPGQGSNCIALGTIEGHVQYWDNVIPKDKAHPTDGPRRGLAERKSTTADVEFGEFDAFDLEADAEMDWIEEDADGEEYSKAIQNEERVASRNSAGGKSIEINQQPSFQPGSTPFRDKRRYLAYNMLGIIHAVQREDSHQVISIEYHDRLSQQGYHWEDYAHFTMSCLGERGTVYAKPSHDNEPSSILYKPARRWASEWNYSLPDNENFVCIALSGLPSSLSSDDEDEDDRLNLALEGSGSVVAATDKQLVRFFTISGLQKYIWNSPGEIVSMAASKDLSIIIYRGHAAGYGGSQNLKFIIIDTDTYEIIQQEDVPLNGKDILSWVGFSQDGIPMIHSSSGMLLMLDKTRRPRQGRWVPVLDTSRLSTDGKKENYWPVGITSTQLICIIMKGFERYPFFPTPLTQEVDLQVPLLNLEDHQGELEERCLRQGLIATHKRDGLPEPCYDAERQQDATEAEMELDKCILKTINAACKADRLDQVIDLTRSLINLQSIEAAGKIAIYFKRPGLRDQINVIRDERQNKEDGGERKKRKSKYDHLEEDRFIVDSTSTGTKTRVSRDPLAVPFDASISLNSDGPRLVRSDRLPLSSVGLSQKRATPEDEESFDLPPPRDQTDSQITVPETNSLSTPFDTSVSQRKPFNPFSKSLAPPSNSNRKGIFAKEPATGNARKSNDLKKSDSFFNRVEQAHPIKPGEQTYKQATLFGMSGHSTDDDLKGKKRKSSSNNDTKDNKKKNLRDRSLSATNSELDDMLENGNDVEGTQQTELQEEPHNNDAPGSPDWPDDLLDDAEEDNDAGENVERMKVSEDDSNRDGISKLAQFRKPSVAVAS